ncbi:MAG: PKD domain-containing protein [Ardenticatenaceae bacterium]|nr:PKD domain-containing protein [Ardenticatenaceae bacterium]
MKQKLVGLGLSLVLAFVFIFCTVVVLLAEGGGPEAPSATLTVCKQGLPTCDFSVIQTAVDAAAPNDIIKVAAGVYTDINTYGGLSQVIFISRQVTIRGGYTTVFTEPPDPENNPTIIDAQGLGRGVTSLTFTGTSVKLSGLQIINGDAADLGGNFNDGSDAGGGIYSAGATLELTDSKVVSNSVSDSLLHLTWAGGIFVTYGAAHIMSSTIAYNYAEIGGGIATLTATLTLNDNVIANNSSEYGGGGFFQATDGEFTGNLVRDNLVDSAYGSFGLGGGALLFDGIFTLTNNLFLHNVSDNLGGGLLTADVDLVMINNMVADNQAGVNGDGLYLTGTSGQLLHNTIADNDFEGVVITGSLSTSGLASYVALTNTVVAGHDGFALVSVPGSTAVLYNTLWYNNFLDYAGNVTTTADFTGNPAFINPSNSNYHITAASAARNQGIPTNVLMDIDGESRSSGPAPDLGADEWQEPTDIPIAGLTAVNNSPTTLGTTTLLTATISSGTNVNYAWNFGDGTTGSGANPAHVYPDLGVYTAVVTASNSLNSMAATTVVTITDVAIGELTAVNNSPTALGTTTLLTATMSSGTNVSYLWNLGDGTVVNGRLVSHTYSMTGTYTAVVTASNSLSLVTATTMVVVTSSPISTPGFMQYLPFITQPIANLQTSAQGERVLQEQ